MKSMNSMMVFAVVAVVFASGCEIAQPFAGPGFKDGKVTSKAAGPFMASTTLLQLEDTNEASDTFNKHMTILQEKLKTQPGLIGLSLAFTPLDNKAGYRTLTVWESEDAMFAWVASDEHAAAMQEMADLAAGGAVAAWELKKDDVIPPTWDDAKARLAKDGHPAY